MEREAEKRAECNTNEVNGKLNEGEKSPERQEIYILVHFSAHFVPFYNQKELSLKPEGVKVSYEAVSQQHKTLFVACKVLYLFTLNLGMFFLVFVLFQIRNIIKSVYLGVKSENSSIDAV